MKVKPTLWATVLLLLAVTFCIFRVSNQRTATAQPPAKPELTPAELEAHRQLVKKQQAGWRYAREHNYRAKVNNGSKRKGLTLEQLPENMREEAAKIANQYTEAIYPSLKKFIAKKNGVLPQPAGIYPEFEPYVQDAEYKGTGRPMYGRGSWHIGTSWRLDGTYVYRDLYSQDPPDAPHDVWAQHAKFANKPDVGQGFMIHGWDDGRVTFDRIEQMYHGTVHRAIGTAGGMAPPGAAGIPPKTAYGLKNWFRELEEEYDKSKAAKPKSEQPTTATNNKESKPDED